MADVERLVLLVAGAGMLLLATLVLAVGIGRTVHRAFAALLGARGLGILLPQASADAQWQATALNLQPYFALAIAPLAAILFATTLVGTARRRLAWTAVVVLVLAEAVYAADHAWFHSLAVGEAAVGALRAAPGLRYDGFGPLAALGALGPAALAVLGVRFAVLYRQAASSPDAIGALLVAGGLIVGGLFDGANRASALASLLDGGAGAYPWLPWGWAVLLLPVAAVVPALLGVTVLATDRSLAPRPLHRVESGLLVLFAVAFFSGFTRLVLPADSDIAGGAVVLVLLGVWRLCMPVLVTFALLRRQPVALAAARPVAVEA